jgi:GT2 family glycosyltransferase
MPTRSDLSGVDTTAVDIHTSTCDLTVVIVNYNVCTFLEQALVSVVRASADLDVEIIVVDNDSVDGSVEMVQAQFPNVTLIVNERNIGFGKANNIGMRRARGRFILVLNPDTIVQEDTFKTFIRFMDDHPEAGMVGCRILNSDGSFAKESRRSFPTPEVAFYKVSGLGRLFPSSRKFGRYNLTYLPEDEVCEVDALSGSCMFVRREAIYSAPSRSKPETNHSNGLPQEGVSDGAGLFDEDFFMYGEDLDWCFRFGQAGWKVYYTPDTQIIHFKGESTKQGEARYVKLFYGAMSRFVQKHFQTKHSWLFSAFLHLGIWVKAAQSLVQQWVLRARIPFLEFVVALLCFDAVALIRSIPSAFSFPRIFFVAVAPSYAALVIACILITGGYRLRKRNRQQPAWHGIGMAFLIVTTASFFIKSIAFSRVVILFGFISVFIFLSVLRWIRRELNERRVGHRQAVLVGPARAAEQFKRMLMSHPSPPLEIVGYVEMDTGTDPTRVMVSTLPRLGRVDQLRDIVRLRHIDDIIFAAGHVTNQSMFTLMQELLDLPIQFKILQPRQTQVVGKDYVGDIVLAAPLMDAEAALSLPRGRLAQRVADISISLVVCLPLIPFAISLSLILPSSAWVRRIREVAFSLPSLITGSRSFIGFDEEAHFRPPDGWRIRPGVIPLVQASRAAELTPDQLQSIYWRYAQSQSLGLDVRIAMSFIRSNSLTSRF